MNVHSLRVALTVAAQGGFAAAARRLDLDPSTVSRLVAALEADLGLRLFQRSTRRLALTDEGRRYLDRAGPLLDALDQARDEAQGGSAAPSGLIRLTTSVAYGCECVTPLLGAFADACPDLSIELVLSDANLDLIGEQIDLALRLAPSPSGDLISARLAHTRYRVCAAPSYLARHGRPETPAALAERDCLRQDLPAYRSRWRFRALDPQQSGDAADQAIDPATDIAIGGRLVLSSPLALRRAARDGLGPALLADWLTDEDRAQGRLVDLFPAHRATATDFDTGVFFLYPSRRFLPLKVRAAIDFFRNRLGAPAPRAGSVEDRRASV